MTKHKAEIDCPVCHRKSGKCHYCKGYCSGCDKGYDECDCLESKEIHSRLDELAAIKPGWHDGEGEAIAPETIEAARIVAPLLVSLGKLYLYPTIDGYVQIEFEDHSFDLVVKP